MPEGEDWTVNFRKKGSVKEYILIGSWGTSGTLAVWGSLDGNWFPVNQMFEGDEARLGEVEQAWGFKMTPLDENKMQIGWGDPFFDNGFRKGGVSSSHTASFTRVVAGPTIK